MKPADLARLFASEAPRLLRRLRRFRGRVEPEDVVQRAFAKLLEVDGDEMKDPKAYLTQLTRNLAIDEVRRQDRAPVSSVPANRLETQSLDLSPEEMLIEGERFAFMMGVVLNLPEKERSALLLAKLGGLSHEEIAAKLGCSRHSVPRYLARALAACTEAMALFEDSGLAEAVSNPVRDDAD